jgi:hypothetical protein
MKLSRKPFELIIGFEIQNSINENIGEAEEEGETAGSF